jgi:hypothetical protein
MNGMRGYDAQNSGCIADRGYRDPTESSKTSVLSNGYYQAPGGQGLDADLHRVVFAASEFKR